MLDQIQTRDASLRELNTTLEREISERKQAEDSARESRERYEAAVAGSNDGIWDWKLDVNQTFLSPRSKEILGFADREMADDLQAWHARVHPDDAERTLVMLQEYLSGRVANFEIEYRLQHKDGSYRWVLSRGQPCGMRPEPVRMAGSHTDITVRKETDAEVDKLHKQLVQTSRQAGMAEVATGVFHNVGNVLNSVNVSVNVLNEQSALQSRPATCARSVRLLESHQADLGSFLTEDAKRKYGWPVFLNELAKVDEEEKALLKSEIQTLVKNVEHIKKIVSMQQSYAKVAGRHRNHQPGGTDRGCVAHACGALSCATLSKCVRDYSEGPAHRDRPAQSDADSRQPFRQRQIRVTKLIRPTNASISRRLTMNEHGRVQIEVVDNGMGIAAENRDAHFLPTVSPPSKTATASACTAARWPPRKWAAPSMPPAKDPARAPSLSLNCLWPKI